MNIKKERHPELTDIEVMIRYQQLTEEVIKIEKVLLTMEHTLTCLDEGRVQRQIAAHEIFYIESVDKHAYIYCKDKVYGTKQRLYQLIEELVPRGFVQVSKACIVNINYVKSIKPLRNSRIEAELMNGEKILINRKYISEIKRILEERI